MNVLSAEFDVSLPFPKRPRVALLVDGENMSVELAGQIILKSAGYGDMIIRRVYGNTQKPSGWDSAPGFRMVHSGIGKNATDMLLCVEAMALMLGGKADVLVIAASDRDYTHLATHLCETGISVIGLGEAKTPAAFRKSCSRFIEIAAVAMIAPKPAITAPVAVKLPVLDQQILKLIAEKGDVSGLRIGLLGGLMHASYKFKISDNQAKTWNVYLRDRKMLYDCDRRGTDAKVRRQRPAFLPN